MPSDERVAARKWKYPHGNPVGTGLVVGLLMGMQLGMEITQ